VTRVQLALALPPNITTLLARPSEADTLLLVLATADVVSVAK